MQPPSVNPDLPDQYAKPRSLKRLPRWPWLAAALVVGAWLAGGGEADPTLLNLYASPRGVAHPFGLGGALTGGTLLELLGAGVWVFPLLLVWRGVTDRPLGWNTLGAALLAALFTSTWLGLWGQALGWEEDVSWRGAWGPGLAGWAGARWMTETLTPVGAWLLVPLAWGLWGAGVFLGIPGAMGKPNRTQAPEKATTFKSNKQSHGAMKPEGLPLSHSILHRPQVLSKQTSAGLGNLGAAPHVSLKGKSGWKNALITMWQKTWKIGWKREHPRGKIPGKPPKKT
ncbi:MAG: hypothetical protein OEV94_11535 [Deltaproteobacteria bacterium]|nr:hypothetical protein [Deltaproteobacteria bacterium]